jgi:hypothetical protein
LFFRVRLSDGGRQLLVDPEIEKQIKKPGSPPNPGGEPVIPAVLTWFLAVFNIQQLNNI